MDVGCDTHGQESGTVRLGEGGGGVPSHHTPKHGANHEARGVAKNRPSYNVICTQLIPALG